MGSGPKAVSGFDLALTEVARDNHFFLVEIGSSRGADLFRGISHRPLWFRNLGHPGIRKALRKVGGALVPSFGANPPMFAGRHVECFDIVLTVHGVGTFDAESKRAVTIRLGRSAIKVLPLERIIASKKATGRPKDLSILPALETRFAHAATRLIRARTRAERYRWYQLVNTPAKG